ncbi:MAG TPA: hypothetical protein VFA19_13295 [Gaiellaceae bacterium]|nr:hypothetical protein [Gaiellaceae bacterium]
MRRGLAWLLALPLIAGGSQAAHVLAYRLVYPSSGVRLHALLATGHGYMARLPLVLAVAAAVALVSLAVAALDAARGRSVRGLPAWAFALLPPAAFVLQEVLERSIHTGTFFWQAVEAPTFLPGLLLQVPFAAAAYVAARVLLRTAAAVGRLIGVARDLPAAPHAPARALPPAALPALRPAPLAGAAAGRAPPFAAF